MVMAKEIVKMWLTYVSSLPLTGWLIGKPLQNEGSERDQDLSPTPSNAHKNKIGINKSCTRGGRWQREGLITPYFTTRVSHALADRWFLLFKWKIYLASKKIIRSYYIVDKNVSHIEGTYFLLGPSRLRWLSGAMRDNLSPQRLEEH